MATRGRSLFLHYQAYNTSSQTYQGGDAANHTLFWVKDNEVQILEEQPLEFVGPGGEHICYGIHLTEIQTLADSGTLSGKSSTTNVIIIPQTIIFDSIIGSGAVLVNHDYGGPDNLRYVAPNGVGIDNGTIQCFTNTDYYSGKMTRGYVIAETTTDSVGRWTRPMALDPGEYVLVFFKQGSYAPTIVPLTVLEYNNTTTTAIP